MIQDNLNADVWPYGPPVRLERRRYVASLSCGHIDDVELFLLTNAPVDEKWFRERIDFIESGKCPWLFLCSACKEGR